MELHVVKDCPLGKLMPLKTYSPALMTTSYLTFLCVEFELTAVLSPGDAVRRDDRDGSGVLVEVVAERPMVLEPRTRHLGVRK